LQPFPLKRSNISCLETSKYRKIVVRPGLRPGPCWRSLQRSPNPLAGARGLAAPPQEQQPRYQPFGRQNAVDPLATFRQGNSHKGCTCRFICHPIITSGWLGSRVVSMLDSSAEGPRFKSQSRRCRVTALGKLFTPIVPLFTKQRNWQPC